MTKKQPRHTLSIVKNSMCNPMPVRQDASVKTALDRLSGSVILDQRGSICSCGRGIAALAGVARQALNGQPIKSLLPGLPVQLGTPGYNIAFAVFHANTRRHTVCQMKKAAGTPVTVDVSLTILETVPEYLFRLEIREHASRAVDAPGATESGQQQAVFQRCA